MLRISGRIYTGLERPSTTECVLVGNDGRIAAVGEEAKRAGHGRTGIPACPKIEELALGSRVACPGFVDAHVHLDSLARELTELDLGATRSLADLLERVADAHAKLPPGRALFGSGWDESTWRARERRLPVREELDRVAPGRAVALRRVCGHLWAVSTRMLELAAARPDLTASDRERLAAVAADGILREDDIELVRSVAEPSPEERAAGLRAAMRHALTLGVTAVHDMGGAGEALAAMGQLPIRVVAAGHGRQECLPHRLHCGPVKVFLDGSIGAHTAAIDAAFADAPGNRGVLLYETRDLVAALRPHHQAGRDLALHAIGGRAIAQALDAFASLGKGAGRQRIEHAEFAIVPALLCRMARLGVMASMQPNFVGRWQRQGGLYEQRFGWKCARRLNPFRSVLRAGIPLAFGSDCMPMGPMFGMRSAMTHPLASERLTFAEALRAYTLAGAEAGGIERVSGSIEPGKDADIVLLSADGADAEISEVFVGGRRVLPRGSAREVAR